MLTRKCLTIIDYLQKVTSSHPISFKLPPFNLTSHVNIQTKIKDIGEHWEKIIVRRRGWIDGEKGLHARFMLRWTDGVTLCLLVGFAAAGRSRAGRSLLIRGDIHRVLSSQRRMTKYNFCQVGASPIKRGRYAISSDN